MNIVQHTFLHSFALNSNNHLFSFLSFSLFNSLFPQIVTICDNKIKTQCVGNPQKIILESFLRTKEMLIITMKKKYKELEEETKNHQMNTNVENHSAVSFITHTLLSTIIARNLMMEYFLQIRSIITRILKAHQKIEVVQELRKLMQKIQFKSSL